MPIPRRETKSQEACTLAAHSLAITLPLFFPRKGKLFLNMSAVLSPGTKALGDSSASQPPSPEQDSRLSLLKSMQAQCQTPGRQAGIRFGYLEHPCPAITATGEVVLLRENEASWQELAGGGFGARPFSPRVANKPRRPALPLSRAGLLPLPVCATPARGPRTPRPAARGASLGFPQRVPPGAGDPDAASGAQSARGTPRCTPRAFCSAPSKLLRPSLSCRLQSARRISVIALGTPSITLSLFPPALVLPPPQPRDTLHRPGPALTLNPKRNSLEN